MLSLSVHSVHQVAFIGMLMDHPAEMPEPQPQEGRGTVMAGYQPAYNHNGSKSRRGSHWRDRKPRQKGKRRPRYLAQKDSRLRLTH
jgi:hypothetical protein